MHGEIPYEDMPNRPEFCPACGTKCGWWMDEGTPEDKYGPRLCPAMPQGWDGGEGCSVEAWWGLGYCAHLPEACRGTLLQDRMWESDEILFFPRLEWGGPADRPWLWMPGVHAVSSSKGMFNEPIGNVACKTSFDLGIAIGRATERAYRMSLRLRKASNEFALAYKHIKAQERLIGREHPDCFDYLKLVERPKK